LNFCGCRRLSVMTFLNGSSEAMIVLVVDLHLPTWHCCDSSFFPFTLLLPIYHIFHDHKRAHVIFSFFADDFIGSCRVVPYRVVFWVLACGFLFVVACWQVAHFFGECQCRMACGLRRGMK